MSRHSNSFSFLPATEAKSPNVQSKTVRVPEDYLAILFVLNVEIKFEIVILSNVRKDETDKNRLDTSKNSQSCKRTLDFSVRKNNVS